MIKLGPFWLNYDLSKAVRFMDDVGWRTRWWGLTLGDFGVGVMRRDRKREGSS